MALLTRNSPGRKWITRVLGVLIVLELLYCLTGNVMLSAGFLKDILNRHPEKLTVDWASAYTIIPGRITVRGFEIHNRTIRTDWEARLSQASFKMILTALLRRSFHVTDLAGSGGDFQLRLIPREIIPEPDSESVDLPSGSARPDVVESNEITSKPRWLIHLNNVDVTDITGVRIEEYAMVTRGRLRGNMRYVTRDTMHVTDTEVVLETGTLHFKNEEIGTDLNIICREVELGPYVPREHRGIKACQFLSGELLLNGSIATVGFLDYYFGNMPWLKIDGSGDVSAHLKVDRGTFSDGSRLDLESDQLSAGLRDVIVRGNGILHGRVSGHGSAAETLMKLDLKDISIDKPDRFKMPIQGPSFKVETRSGPVRLEKALPDISVTIEIPDTEIPDLSVYNDLFPENSGFRVLTGSAARVGAHLEIAQGAGECRLEIDGPNVGFSVRDQSMRGHMQLQAHIQSNDPQLKRLFLPQLAVNVTDLHLANRETGTVDDWTMSLTFSDATMEMTRPMVLNGQSRIFISNTGGLARALVRTESPWFREYLLFHDVRGQGRFNLDGKNMSIEDLAVTGEGVLPAQLNIGSLLVNMNCGRFDFREGWQNLSLKLALPDTPIKDLSVFNSYLPDSSGFAFKKFSSGRARLTLDIEDGSAGGEFSLTCPGAGFTLRGQPFVGDITLKIHLKNPRIDSRIFDISGSHLMIDRLRGKMDPMTESWWGSLSVPRGTVEASRPLKIRAETDIRMEDSRPVIALFQENKKWVKVFRDLLEIDDIKGSARFNLERGRTTIDDLYLTGDRLVIRSRILLRKNATTGIFYTRLRGFAVGVELKDGQRNTRFLKPRKWFDNYPWATQQ